MQDARYFRSQAKMCLKIAAQLSAKEEAENLRRMAADYLRRATNLEDCHSGAPDSGSATAGGHDGGTPG